MYTINDWLKKIHEAILGLSGASSLSESITATRSVGGIAEGKTYEAGTSVETILRDMLSPSDGN